LVTIQDVGTSLNDTLVLSDIRDAASAQFYRVGDDLYLNDTYVDSGAPDEGVMLKDWFAGSNTIEYVQTADGLTFSLPTFSDGFSLFG
jgi:hypothetical protein